MAFRRGVHDNIPVSVFTAHEAMRSPAAGGTKAILPGDYSQTIQNYLTISDLSVSETYIKGV